MFSQLKKGDINNESYNKGYNTYRYVTGRFR